MGKVLPKNWVYAELGELFNLIYGKGISVKDLIVDDNLYSKLYNVYGANGIIGKFNRYTFKKSKIIISCRGAASGVIHETQPFSFVSSNSIVLNEVDETRTNLAFIKYAMTAVDKTHVITGTAQPQITIQLLKYLQIPLPPLAEQERIVAKLDALFTQHEAMKQTLERIPQLLKNFRQQVLTKAVTGKLTEKWREGKDLENGEVFLQRIIKDRNESDASLRKKLSYSKIEDAFDIPKEWSFSYLQYLGEFTRGKSKHRPRNDKKLFGGNYPFIQTGDVSNAKLYIKEFKSTYSDFGLSQSRLFPKGTLCITVAANIAETAILNFDGCFPDSVVGYVPFKNLYTSEFAMYFINTIQQELEHYAPATAQKNINMAILSEIPFPIPPLQEQKEIINRVESLFAIADKIEEKYKAAKAKVVTLPQAILHKALKGELVEQLPTDGDARELVEEIKKLRIKK